MRFRHFAIVVLFGLSSAVGFADGPQDNLPEQVRPVPPPGIEVPEAEQAVLEIDLARLGEAITELRKSKNPTVRDLVPDVEIFHRAVHDALTYNEVFAPGEIEAARTLLRTGLDRAQQLAQGLFPWTTQTGLVVRGYVSRIDQSVQPYGLVIPVNSQPGIPARLDIWLHGRGEKLSELSFLNQRMNQVGPISPAGTIVLHPYGRYCNAFKFAGEVDILESMAAVKRHYAIDDDRVAIRGFSMGGAGCWQMAVHYPDLWFAANPGAGFSETPEFLKVFQREKVEPFPWEKTLWRMYDCPGYCRNLFNCPTIAYSGELDSQKQAADVMEKALREEGITLTHLIGPQTKHSIHSATGAEIERRLASLAARGRDRAPRRVELSTFTLKYNRMHWLRLSGLEQHWEQATATGEITGPDSIEVTIRNVTGFTLHFESGLAPFDLRKPVNVTVNGKAFVGATPQSDRSWTFHWRRGEMESSDAQPASTLVKRPGLQGPIDDAFMDSFIVVRPTGTARHELVDRWSKSECDHLIREWRRHFRGNAIVKDDTAITDADIQSSNLILFGDEQSNQVIAKVRDKLPLIGQGDQLTVGDQKFDRSTTAAVLIYPNPLNPDRYVVLNSGFTFREYDYLNNARQVPRLPDWAIIDLTTPPNSRHPGKVVTAGFFNEEWQ